MIFGTNIVYENGDDHKEKFVCSSFSVGQQTNIVYENGDDHKEKFVCSSFSVGQPVLDRVLTRC